MASQHHGDGEQSRLIKRFFDQANGQAKRAYPNGRVGADDEGELAYAIAADPRHQIIRIEFNKPVDWIGLDRASAEKLRDILEEKLMELRGIRADC
jgi:hypothetical protein